MAQLSFDARNVAPSVPLEPLDDGWYPAVITETEIKPTASGDGVRMPLKLKVLPDHPHYGNRLIFDGLNIQNPNPVAQQIAQEQLSAICHATNVIVLNDTQQLHNIPLLVKVVTTPKRTDTVTGKTYDAKNEVKGYAKLGTQEVNVAPPKKALAVGGAGAPPAWSAQAPPAGATPAAVPSMAPAVATPPFVPQAAPQAAPAAAPVPEAPAWSKPAETPVAAPAAAPVATEAAPAAAAAAPAWATQAPAAGAPAPAAEAAAPAPAVPSWAQGAQA